MLAFTCIIFIAFSSCYYYFLRKLFKIYRYKLELYQILLVQFIPDKVSELAMIHQPELELIMEDDEEYMLSTKDNSKKFSSFKNYRP